MKRTYAFHGVQISIDADRDLVAAIDSRLGAFLSSSASYQQADITFAFERVASSDEHVVQPPSGPTRRVYEPVIGEVLYSEASDSLYLDFGGQVRATCDASSGNVRVSVCEGQANNVWLLSRPMLTLPLLELAKRRGLYSVHAAGLSLQGQGLLAPGGSGSGKSTLALALARAGFDYLGDDMLFLRSTSNGLLAGAMPEEVDVTVETLALLPELEGRTTIRAGWPKQQVQPKDAYGTHLALECAPRLLVFPRVSGQAQSRLEPMSTDQALLELAPNVLLTQPAAAQAHLAALAKLARSVPCYRLHTGRDFDELAERLKGLLLG